MMRVQGLLREESEVQERLERAKRGLPESTYADYYVDPMQPVDQALQSFDPKKEPMQQRKKKEKPEPPTVDQMLSRYYVAVIYGKLNNVLSTRDATGGDCGDEGQAVIRYVEAVMSHSKDALKPLLLHKLGGNPWASWYGTPSRSLASYLYDDFRDRLKVRLKEKPFVYDPTPVFREDHLEAADRANYTD
jgi:hypothetical protein